MSFFDNFPFWARFIVVLLCFLLAAPILMFIYTATNRGSYVEIGSFKLGEREDPSVKKCEIFINGKVEIIKALRDEVTKLTDLLQSEIAATHSANTDLKNYTPGDSVLFDMSGRSRYSIDVLENLQRIARNREITEKETRKNLIASVERSIRSIENIGNICLDSSPRS